MFDYVLVNVSIVFHPVHIMDPEALPCRRHSNHSDWFLDDEDLSQPNTPRSSHKLLDNVEILEPLDLIVYHPSC